MNTTILHYNLKKEPSERIKYRVVLKEIIFAGFDPYLSLFINEACRSCYANDIYTDTTIAWKLNIF